MIMTRTLTIAMTMTLLVTPPAFAGSIDQSTAPTAGGRMYTLEQIYNKLHDGTNATKHADGAFTEPATGPASTMNTLDDVYNDFKTDADSCNTVAANVLSGTTFFAATGTTRGTNWGPVSGTMTDREGDNASTAQVAAAGVNYLTAPAGYYDGDDRVSATDAEVAALASDLTAANVLTGATIFGVVGSGGGGGSYGIPKTQQTTSYADYDDGYYEKGTPASGDHFTDNGDGTITDNATGLMWVTSGYADADTNPATTYTADGSYRKYTWANALLYCYRLNDTTQFPPSGYLGHSDWRLPNVKELQSIVNYGNWSPAIGESTVGGSGTGAPFTNTKSASYWSGTTFASSTTSAWYVSFSSGTVLYGANSTTYYVRPVRGG